MFFDTLQCHACVAFGPFLSLAAGNLHTIRTDSEGSGEWGRQGAQSIHVHLEVLYVCAWKFSEIHCITNTHLPYSVVLSCSLYIPMLHIR